MRVGIYGCGQLARMMALAGLPMGMQFGFLAGPGETTSAVDGLGDVVTLDPNMDAKAVYTALGEPQVITVEKEQVDSALLAELEAWCSVAPSSQVLFQCQDRVREKRLLEQVGVAATPYRPLQTAQDVYDAGREFGWPLVVKHARQGYDGKSQWRLRDEAGVAEWLAGPGAAALCEDEPLCLAEPMMPYELEASFIAVRSAAGEVRHYDPAQNEHQNGILLSSVVPAPGLSAEQMAAGQASLAKIMTESGYVGVMAMECFLVRGELFVNEMAPRVHNSGHWTQFGADTCQFENHMRAVAGWPLGSTQAEGPSAMLNLLGVAVDQPQMLADDVCLHWYNKSVKPGRKVGHLLLKGADQNDVIARLQRLQQAVYGKTD